MGNESSGPAPAPTPPPSPPTQSSVSVPRFSCELSLYTNPGYGGARSQFYLNHPNLSTNGGHGINTASDQYVGADEECLITAYTDLNYTGDAVMLKRGHTDIYKSPYGVGATGRNFNDDYDSIRFDNIPRAGANEIEYHINTVSQRPINKPNPSMNIGNATKVYYERGETFIPCPGASKVFFNSASGIKCIYSKNDASQIQALHDTVVSGRSKSNQVEMLTAVRSQFCKSPDNAFKSVGGGTTCMEHGSGQNLAIEYCEKDNRIIEGPRGDPNCNSTSLDPTNYNRIASKFCDNTPQDVWCGCYNTYKHSTDGQFCTSNPTAAGCQKMKESHGKLVEKTPSDQKVLWDGMQPCFGGVCGTGTFKPIGYNDNCGKSVNVCIQDFTVEGLNQSSVDAACVINAGGPSGVSSGQDKSAREIIDKDRIDKAMNEIKDAKAAVAAGEPGAQGRLNRANKAYKNATMKIISLSDFKSNPQAYTPQNIEGLKIDRRQQLGTGIVGAVALAFVMILLLLLMS